MINKIVNRKIEQDKGYLNRLLIEIEHLSSILNLNDLKPTISRLRISINEPLLLGVIGEVNSGKSSFINALLNQKEICATNCLPCTKYIEQLYYSESEKKVLIGRELKKIGKPIEILKYLSIVDTPGTNSLIESHEIITREYIPNSNLIIFVFPAENPHLKSAWDLLDLIDIKWKKKIIFVLQKSDLIPQTVLQAQIDAVKQYATERQINSPKVFTTSAKLETEGETETSGFKEIREFINKIVVNGETYQLKLTSVRETIQEILTVIDTEIHQRQQKIQLAVESKNKIEASLNEIKQFIKNEGDNLVTKLINEYDYIASYIKSELRQDLSFLKLVKQQIESYLNRQKSTLYSIKYQQKRSKLWLQNHLNEIVIESTDVLVCNCSKIPERFTLNDGNIKPPFTQPLKFNFSLNNWRNNIIKNCQSQISILLTNEKLVSSCQKICVKANAGIVAGFCVSIVSVFIVHLVAEIIILDIIAGIFIGLGSVFSGIMFFWKQQRIINRFEKELNKEKSRFKIEIREIIDNKLELILSQVDAFFRQYLKSVEKDKRQVEEILSKHQQINKQAKFTFEFINLTLSYDGMTRKSRGEKILD